MNCYEFENNITEYIDGDLKMGARKSFMTHKSDCKSCRDKLEDILFMLKEMPSMIKMETSKDFLDKLNDKIDKHENRKVLKIDQFFGFDFISLTGLAAAITLIIGASYLLINENTIPVVDLEKISTKSKTNMQNPEIILNNQSGFIANQDSSENESDKNQYDLPIRLVGGSK